MSRPGPYERRHLKIDLLETLLANEVYGPNSIPVEEVLNWFAVSEQEVAESLIEEMHANEDCPLGYEIGEHSRIWLRDKQETQEFIKELREDPAWYE